MKTNQLQLILFFSKTTFENHFSEQKHTTTLSPLITILHNYHPTAKNSPKKNEYLHDVKSH